MKINNVITVSLRRYNDLVSIRAFSNLKTAEKYTQDTAAKEISYLLKTENTDFLSLKVYSSYSGIAIDRGNITNSNVEISFMSQSGFETLRETSQEFQNNLEKERLKREREEPFHFSEITKAKVDYRQSEIGAIERDFRDNPEFAENEVGKYVVVYQKQYPVEKTLFYSRKEVGYLKSESCHSPWRAPGCARTFDFAYEAETFAKELKCVKLEIHKITSTSETDFRLEIPVYVYTPEPDVETEVL